MRTAEKPSSNGGFATYDLNNVRKSKKKSGEAVKLAVKCKHVEVEVVRMPENYFRIATPFRVGRPGRRAPAQDAFGDCASAARKLDFRVQVRVALECSCSKKRFFVVCWRRYF